MHDSLLSVGSGRTEEGSSATSSITKTLATSYQSGAPVGLTSPVRKMEVADRSRVSGRRLHTGGVFLMAFLLAAGATFGFVCVRAYLGSQQFPVAQLPKAPAATPPSQDLGLRVQPSEERLLISWDRDSEKVRNSARGILTIQDGPNHRVLDLDAKQVATGSVLYRPSTGDIALELLLLDDSGGSTTQTYRILDSSMGGRPRFVHADRQSGPDGIRASDETSSTVPIAGTVLSAPNAYQTKTTPIQPAPVPLKRESPADTDAKVRDDSNFLHLSSLQVVERSFNLPRNLSESVGHSVPAASIPLPSVKTNVPPAGIPGPSSAAGPPQTQTKPDLDLIGPKPIRIIHPDASVMGGSRIVKPSELQLYLQIDERGAVISARPISSDPSIGAQLVVASVAAARQWRFKPALKDGVPVRSNYSIVFRFRPAKP